MQQYQRKNHLEQRKESKWGSSTLSLPTKSVPLQPSPSTPSTRVLLQ